MRPPRTRRRGLAHSPPIDAGRRTSSSRHEKKRLACASGSRPSAIAAIRSDRESPCGSFGRRRQAMTDRTHHGPPVPVKRHGMAQPPSLPRSLGSACRPPEDESGGSVGCRPAPWRSRRSGLQGIPWQCLTAAPRWARSEPLRRSDELHPAQKTGLKQRNKGVDAWCEVRRRRCPDRCRPRDSAWQYR